MRRDATPRSRQPDLLVREPCRSDPPDRPAPLAPDPVAAVVELADLLARGLIGRGDLAAQVAKVLGVDPVGDDGPTAGPTSCAGRLPPLRHATRRRACGRSS
jgi:hypothetical protein